VLRNIEREREREGRKEGTFIIRMICVCVVLRSKGVKAGSEGGRQRERERGVYTYTHMCM
jgi:hypothetical protein